ncbi:MAG: NlpC/P60 family protein, partial [Nitrososphaerales archaeon]
TGRCRSLGLCCAARSGGDWWGLTVSKPRAVSGVGRAVSMGAASVTAVLSTLIITGTSFADPSTSAQLEQTGADLQGAQAKAADLAAQIQSDSDKLDVLDQQYEAAQQQVQTLDQSLIQTEARLVATEASVNSAQAQLRQQALLQYTNATADQSLAQMFAPPGGRASLTQHYQQMVSAKVSQTIDRLRVARGALSQEETQVRTTEAQASASASQIDTSRSQAQAVMSSEQAALGQVNGQIATLLAQREASEQAAEASAFAARVAGSGPVSSNVPVSAGAVGAVQAAQSQLGVPYVWGGEDPGAGFDCSGLTQWAWGRAGVSIPRTAEEQYDAIPHVALSALEPGDLLFWDDGTSSVQHVAMYVGNNEVIQAPQTGQTVSYSPIWGNGLVGAGRP